MTTLNQRSAPLSPIFVTLPEELRNLIAIYAHPIHPCKLEILDDAARNALGNRCANGDCIGGRFFQGADTGLLYCSPQCAGWEWNDSDESYEINYDTD